jgi:hypothetical protein
MPEAEPTAAAKEKASERRYMTVKLQRFADNP